jgi:hypothetical protein
MYYPIALTGGTLRSCRRYGPVRLIPANLFGKDRPSDLTIIADPSCILATHLRKITAYSSSLLRDLF